LYLFSVHDPSDESERDASEERQRVRMDDAADK